MAGYSGTPLARKLGIKPGTRLCFVNAPPGYVSLLEPLPEELEIVSEGGSELDIVHGFVRRRADLIELIERYKNMIKQEGAIWISWPKKAARIATDVTEDTVREIALPLGLVDIKVCAVDEVWSGLKLVIRKENRRR
jgi:bifunctional DNA-binding transcriptional regulator/antitoxin component of YhaV-PrlF toxin-antitoxin module